MVETYSACMEKVNDEVPMDDVFDTKMQILHLPIRNYMNTM